MDRTEAIFINFDTEAAGTQAEVLDQTMGHFRVHVGLFFKANLSAKFFL